MANINLKSVLREIKQHAGAVVAFPPKDPALLERAVRGIRASHRARKRRTWVTVNQFCVTSKIVANAKTPTGRGQFSSQRNPWRVTIRRLAPYLLDLMPDLSKGQAEGIARSIQLGLRSNAPDSEVAAMIEQYDLDEQRAILIARTEMARARADTELGRLKPNERVVYVLADDACSKCVKIHRKLKGRKLTAKQAEGIIPVHPNCYCRWKVVNRKSGREIVRNEGGANIAILEYSRLVDNVFCATGEGGGVDPSCSSGEKKTPEVGTVEWDIDHADKIAPNVIERTQAKHSLASDPEFRKGTVSGLRVTNKIPNTDSISSTFDDQTSTTLDGVREVPMTAFDEVKDYEAADDNVKVSRLVDKIKENG